MTTMEFSEMIKLVAPILILQLGLVIYCLVDIRKNGVRNLNIPAWVVIVLFINMFGAIAYLIFGRGVGDNVED